MHDLLVTNGRIIDGTGSPSFHGDVAIKDGKITELGKLGGSAKRVIDVKGLVIAPGFVDNHCHYDAQVGWDPLCTFSNYHGATTVIMGNCSLTLAPVRKADRERLAGMLSYVEAIPMEVLQAGVKWNWETFPDYMQTIGKKLGVNVGNLIGHSAVRLYAMGQDCHEREASAEELVEMRRIVAEALHAGALGISFTRNMKHRDILGKRIPGAYAPESEIFALADVLREVGTGVIQCGDAVEPELKDRLMSRLSEASGRRVMYNILAQHAQYPGRWKEQLAQLEIMAQKGIRANPMCCPNSIYHRFSIKNMQIFQSYPTWAPILKASEEEKLNAYRDPEFRRKIKAEVDAPLTVLSSFTGKWDLMWVDEPYLDKNKDLKGKSIAELAEAQGKHPVDAFLDLGVEEGLKTTFTRGVVNTDIEAVGEILRSPHAIVGLSDGGAHVQFESTASIPTRLLGFWVREKGIMSLEHAVRRLTLDSASAFGIYDRGVLHPGRAADLVVFDPDTVSPGKKDKVEDLPANGMRIREIPEGIHYTVVNGEVFMENNEHVGSYPGRVLKNPIALQ